MKHIYNPAKKHHQMFFGKGTFRMLWGFVAFVLPLLIFSGCMEDDFDQDDLRDSCPRVTSRTPGHGVDNVPTNTPITAKFNKEMTRESIHSGRFSVINKSDNSNIPGDLALYPPPPADPDSIVFTPRNLLPPLTSIEVTISKYVRDLYDFNLEGDVVWTFETGPAEMVSKPRIVSKSPGQGAVNVVLNTHVVAEFSEPLDPATVNLDNFKVNLNGNAIDGTVYYSNKVAWFMPENYLESFTEYEVVITKGIADPYGNNMEEDAIWTFTTGDVIERIPDAVDISKISGYVMLSGRFIRNLGKVDTPENEALNASSITGDVGLYPGVFEDIVNIDTMNHVDGTVYVIGGVPVPGLPRDLIWAKQRLADAYEYAKNASVPEPQTISGNLGGTTLTPGIYTTHTLKVHNGDLTLDAQGNPHQFWIFQVESLLETTGNIILTGGADPRNIYWQVGIREVLGPNVLIGNGTSFAGNILSKQGVSMGRDAHINGRLFVLDGGIRLDKSTVVIP